jgi:hypothetical protein
VINNTAVHRWRRSADRNLDAQFLNAIMTGMNCSPFEAEAIRDAVHSVYGPLMESADTLKPGQIRISVIDASVAPNIPLAQALQCLVVLTLDAGEPDRQVRREHGVTALRRQRFLRICEEAFQQGGLLTLEAISDLFNCAVRTLVTDLAAVRAAGITPPLRSTVKDMGRAVTHRRQIVEQWLAGREYSDIARSSRHSIASVANYVEKFKRCSALLGSGFDLETTAAIARMSPSLARMFSQLVAEARPVAHRREELEKLTQKNTLQIRHEGRSTI